MSSIVHFEIRFDEAERARKFYTELFGWKKEKAHGTEYWMITNQEGTYGGIMKRFNPKQKITDYFGVQSLLEVRPKISVTVKQ
jgi:predicted enzyme related to lactoylglutathione lyase